MEGFGSIICSDIYNHHGYSCTSTSSQLPNLRFLSDIPTYLVLPRPKCPSMFDGFALYNVNHRNHRLFRRYLSAINFPRNIDFAHVSVCISLSMYSSSCRSKKTYVNTSPGCRAIMTVSLFLRFSSSAICFSYILVSIRPHIVRRKTFDILVRLDSGPLSMRNMQQT